MTKNQTSFYPVNMTEEERVRRNKPLIDVIIKLLKAQAKFGNNPIEYNKLLDLAVREYILPQDHWHISEAAKNIWDSITDDDIRKYTYQQKIPINKIVGSMQICGMIITKDDKIPFNKIFISEHITPVADVIKVLQNQPSPLTPDRAKEILDKMHIARILQSENKKIKKRYNRWTNFSDVPDCRTIIDKYYSPVGIHVIF